MAVTKMPQLGTLSIKYQTGMNSNGDPTYSTRNFPGLKPNATDQDAYDVAVAIAGVCKHPLAGIIRQDKANLING